MFIWYSSNMLIWYLFDMFICYLFTCSCRTPVHMITSSQAHMFIRARVHNYIRTHMIAGHTITYTLDHPMVTRSLAHTRSTQMLACSLVYSPMRSYGMYTWCRMLTYTYAHVYTLIHTVHMRTYTSRIYVRTLPYVPTFCSKTQKGGREYTCLYSHACMLIC